MRIDVQAMYLDVKVLGCDQTNMFRTPVEQADFPTDIARIRLAYSLSNRVYYFLETLSGLIPFIDPQ
jgi:hypothetical protein